MLCRSAITPEEASRSRPDGSQPNRRPSRLRFAAAAFALGIVAAACGGSDRGGNSYPENVRSNFLRTCVGGVVTQQMCTCMIDSLEDIYKLEDFQAMEQRLQRGQPDAKFEQIIEDCVDANLR